MLANVVRTPLAYTQHFKRLFRMDKKRLETSFGFRCRELRDRAGLSQEKFALSIGMDRSYYASIEVGIRNVTLVNKYKIARGYGISLSELLEDVQD